MKCVKCGFEKESDSFELCEKCGAVQSKSIKYLEGKKNEACEKIDILLLDLKKLNDECASLVDLITNDAEYDKKTKDEILKNINDIKAGIEKTTANINSLKKHVISFSVDYEINAKLKKAHEYIVTYENEHLEFRKKYTGISTKPAKQNDLLSSITTDDKFGRPEIPQPDYEKVRDVEFSLSLTKYPALETLAGIYKTLAFIVMGLSLLAALAILLVQIPGTGGFWLGMGSRVAACFITLLCGGVVGLSLLAVSESIKVLVDLECNSRAIMEYTKALFLTKK